MSRRTVRSRPLLVGLAALVLVVTAACGGGGDDSAGDGSGSASGTNGTGSQSERGEGTTEGEGEPVGVDPYDGHTSKIYDGTENWICHPDLDDDVCGDLDVTTVDASGGAEVEERSAAADAPIDCFYIYPTVSLDQGANSDLEVAPDDNEVLTVVAQAAQFARSCRVFAPVYRQVPLSGLGGGRAGTRPGWGRAHADVLDAWKTYISQYNEGRGVIVIGHSQGTGHLIQLLQREVDDVPALRRRLVAAYLFGGAVQVPEGELVGGSFDHIPGCSTADEVGCIVTWSSYPASEPPVDNAIFGRSREAGQRALCVNVLDLLDRDTGDPIAPVKAPLVGGAAGPDLAAVETPFFALPDAVELSCQTHGAFDYLGVAIADPGNDQRDLDRMVQQILGPTWGLHLLDMTVALDDLVELARRQGEAFTR